MGEVRRDGRQHAIKLPVGYGEKGDKSPETLMPSASELSPGEETNHPPKAWAIRYLNVARSALD
jgi:hypothetical protein